MDSVTSKAGIFDAGLGEILRFPLLQRREKRKFQPDSRKPGVTDPSLTDLANADKWQVREGASSACSRNATGNSQCTVAVAHAGEPRGANRNLVRCGEH